MTQLVITRGLPASGKTTWAKEWVAQQPEGRARVNRDDLRFNLYDKYWPLTHGQEGHVTAVQKAAVTGLLKRNMSVVVDDTHLRLAHARAWADLALELGVDFKVQEFTDVPLGLCIERDQKREEWGERHVGSAAISDLNMKFLNGRTLPPVVPSEKPEGYGYQYAGTPGKPDVWLVDIDGTLAKMNGRGPFEWHKVGEDLPVEAVVRVVRTLWLDDEIIVMSGRDSVCRTQTVTWLLENDISYCELFMRPAGDSRKDWIVKLELFREQVAPHYNVIGVFDDRQQVVDMWRAIGLPCFQVAPGQF